MKKINADLLLIMVAVIWGSGFIATEYAINSNLGPTAILAVRFSVAAVIMVIYSIKEIKKATRSEWIKGSIAGVVLVTAFFLQTLGQTLTTVSNCAFLTATNVMFVPFIVWFIVKKKPELKIFILAFITFIGVVILTGSSLGNININRGDFYVLMCAILFAFHIAYLSIAVDGNSPKVITTIQLLVSAVLATVVMLFKGVEQFEGVDFGMAIPSVLFLGAFSTCLCFFLQTYAQKRTSPGKAGIILSTESLFGTIFSVVLGIEPLTTQIVVGGLIIFTSVILTEVDLKGLKFLKTETT